MLHRRRVLTAALATGLSVGAAGGIAAAAGSNPTTADTTPTTEPAGSTDSTDSTAVAPPEDPGDEATDDTVSWESSVTIADTDGRPTAADLVAVATVTAQDALTAALADTPGTVVGARLVSVDGNVVWVVGVLDEAGETIRVVVDAGNASVLDAGPAPERPEFPGDGAGPGRRGGDRERGGDRGVDDADDGTAPTADQPTTEDSTPTTTTG